MFPGTPGVSTRVRQCRATVVLMGAFLLLSAWVALLAAPVWGSLFREYVLLRGFAGALLSASVLSLQDVSFFVSVHVFSLCGLSAALGWAALAGRFPLPLRLFGSLGGVLLPLEFVSFGARGVSHSVRLVCNQLSGHVCFSVVASLSLYMPFVLSFCELFSAFVQAEVSSGLLSSYWLGWLVQPS